MKDRTRQADFREAICHQCKQPMEYPAPRAVRVPIPGLPGAGYAVCSLRCAADLAGTLERFIPPEPVREWKVEPAPGTEGACGCGCGGTPKTARFLPGHDAKLKAVRRASRDGGQ